MTLAELLRKLVEESDPAVRMQLVEDNQELLTIEGGNGEDWKKKYEELHAKYVERFFSKPSEKIEEVEGEKDSKTDEEKIAESITIDDLFEEEEDTK